MVSMKIFLPLVCILVGAISQSEAGTKCLNSVSRHGSDKDCESGEYIMFFLINPPSLTKNTSFKEIFQKVFPALLV